MSNWENFEAECTDYLNRNFGDYAVFMHQGGSDSTVPDILVKTHSGASFYMDVKLPQAQCGQFVLLPNIDTCSFDYSSLNANSMNVYSEKIINYMNQSFDDFRDAGTTGKDIDMDSDVFYDWIIKTQREKGTRYFITGEHTIFPVEMLRNYFDVSAKYRIKRSGSGNVGKARIKTVLDYVCANEYNVIGVRIDGDKLFISSNAKLHNQRFILCGFEYMFSIRGHEYEIRKLSNTYNANVIFSISQISTNGLTNKEFIDSLE